MRKPKKSPHPQTPFPDKLQILRALHTSTSLTNIEFLIRCKQWQGIKADLKSLFGPPFCCWLFFAKWPTMCQFVSFFMRLFSPSGHPEITFSKSKLLSELLWRKEWEENTWGIWPVLYARRRQKYAFLRRTEQDGKAGQKKKRFFADCLNGGIFEIWGSLGGGGKREKLAQFVRRNRNFLSSLCVHLPKSCCFHRVF